jgi:CBS domain-containing protein
MTVLEAARLMQKSGYAAIAVVDGGRLVGVFTERDAVSRVIAAERDPAATRLAEVMTANPRTIEPDQPFGHALHVMHEGGFRHVPVVEHGRFIGMVSARDALGPEVRDFVSELEQREHIGEILG